MNTLEHYQPPSIPTTGAVQHYYPTSQHSAGPLGSLPLQRTHVTSLDAGAGAAPPPHYYHQTEPSLVNAMAAMSNHGPQMTSSLHLDHHHHQQHQQSNTHLTWFWSQTQLCILTFSLSLMVALNAGLLFWILSYLNFDHFAIESTPNTSEHLHPKSVDRSGISSSSNRVAIYNGLRISGGPLQAHSIDAPNGEQLQIMSPSGVALGTKDLTIDDQQSSKLSKSHGSLWLQIAQKKVIANSCNLIVKSAADENLLLLLQDSIDNQQTSVIGVDSIQIKGSTGLLLNSSIQVPTIYSDEKLFLYSPNQKVQIRGPKQINIFVENELSSNTFIGITSAAQLKLESTSAKVFLNASLIIFSHRLLTVHPSRQGRTYPSIGQLCVCAKNGKIFKSTHHHPRSCLTAAQFEC